MRQNFVTMWLGHSFGWYGSYIVHCLYCIIDFDSLRAFSIVSWPLIIDPILLCDKIYVILVFVLISGMKVENHAFQHRYTSILAENQQQGYPIMIRMYPNQPSVAMWRELAVLKLIQWITRENHQQVEAPQAIQGNIRNIRQARRILIRAAGGLFISCLMHSQIYCNDNTWVWWLVASRDE